MKKICYVTTISLSLKSFFVSQLNYLAKNGYEVTAICSPDDDMPAILGPDVRYVPINIPRGISFGGMIKAIADLTAFFKQEKFDMVQYSTPNAGLCAAIAAKLAGVPIRNYHLMGLRYLGDSGFKKTLLKGFEKISCSLSTHIECVSNSNLKLAIEDNLFPKKKATVVFNGSSGGIDTVRFDAQKRDAFCKTIREKYNIPADAFVFGFVGRITRDKGINEILTAFNQISDCKLLMVGFTDEVDTLDQALYQQSLENPDIIYTGPVTDVEKYFAAIDCLLLPSYREGFGNVVIEAAAMGTPAIVSNIPGPIDASENKKTALWVAPKDCNALFDAMEEMKKRANEMQKDCITFATEKFDQELLNVEIKKRKDYLMGI